LHLFVGQHVSPDAPQQTPLVQVPPVEHVDAGPTHVSLPGSQHPWLGPTPAHNAAGAAQHTSLALPHCTQEPALQMFGAGTPGQATPWLTQDPLARQHPPLSHLLFAQQMLPEAPQPVHVPPVQTWLGLLQAFPLPTHFVLPGSQQSPAVVHMFPAQHGSVVPPQVWQVPPLHTRVPAEHAGPDVQHGWVAPPQATHEPMSQTRPLLEQALPEVQHGWPGPPHATQEPP
jgi:hypothetical protein